MAMRQAGERAEMCDTLGFELDAFLQHILKVRHNPWLQTHSRHAHTLFFPP